jgi:hypothetical protein
MRWALIPSVCLSGLLWVGFALSASRYIRNANRVREYINNHHPDWWVKLCPWEWQRNNPFIYTYRATSLDRLITFGNSVLDREPDLELDRLLRDARWSALLSILIMTLAIVSLGLLTFNN